MAPFASLKKEDKTLFRLISCERENTVSAGKEAKEARL